VIYITAVRMSKGGSHHQNLQRVQWLNPSSLGTGEESVAELVRWIRHKRGEAWVRDGLSGGVPVRVVDGDPPFLRTRTTQDERWTDHLLRLPRY